MTFQYNAEDVDATIIEDGKTTRRRIAIPKDAKLTDNSIFWFYGVTPKKGDVAKFSTLDPETLEWSVETMKYDGEETIEHHGMNVRAHKLVSAKAPMWVTSDGKLLRMRIEESGIALEIVAD